MLFIFDHWGPSGTLAPQVVVLCTQLSVDCITVWAGAINSPRLAICSEGNAVELELACLLVQLEEHRADAKVTFSCHSQVTRTFVTMSI